MKKLKAALIMSTALVLAACVTINVYFPAAAAERAAEQFVGDVLAVTETLAGRSGSRGHQGAHGGTPEPVAGHAV